MKLRVFATPQRHVLAADLTRTVQHLDALGLLGIRGTDTEQTLEFDIAGEDATAAGQAVRDLEVAMADLGRSGTSLRCELAGGPAAIPAGTRPTAPLEELPAVYDLDGARVQTVLPRLLSTPTALAHWRRGRSPVNTLSDPLSEVGGAGASVVRIQKADAEEIVAVASERPARFGGLAAPQGGRIAIAETMRELACRGAAPRAIRARLRLSGVLTVSDVVQAADRLRVLVEACTAFEVDLSEITVELSDAAATIGNGSRVSVEAIGSVADERNVMRACVSGAGQNLVLLGEAPHELGGSHFLAVIHGRHEGEAPAIDLAAEIRLNDTLLALNRGGITTAVRPLAAGGLLVAASEMLFAEGRTFGAKLDLTPLGGARADALLFGESQGRAIVAVAAERVGTVLAEAHMRGVPAALMGEVTDGPALMLKTRSLATEWPAEELRRQRVSAG